MSANDILEAVQCAGSWMNPGYLYVKLLKEYLEYFSFFTKRKNRYFKKIIKILFYMYLNTWPMPDMKNKSLSWFCKASVLFMTVR